MILGYWRRRCMPIVAQVLMDTAGQPERVIRARLAAAYPFGKKHLWPYKVWLDEIQRQRHGPKARVRKVGKCATNLLGLELEGQERLPF